TALQLLDMAREMEWDQTNTLRAVVPQQLADRPFFPDQMQFLKGLAQQVMSETMNDQAQTLLIRKAMSYMAAHMQEDCPIEQVAQFVNLSAAYLCVIFKKETGMTINQYKNKLKLEKAKVLLQDSTIRI